MNKAPRPWSSWQKCLEEGGEHSGGLDLEAGAWGGCVELGCFEEKEKHHISLPLRKTPRPQYLSLGSPPQHSEPPALLPGL